MHHFILDQWSRCDSPLHRLDARAKLAALLAILVSISTAAPSAHKVYAAQAALLLVALFVSRLPVLAILKRAAVVLPFTTTFVLFTWVSGDPVRALALAEKTLLSGWAVLTLVATTPLAEITAALDFFRVPRPLLLVVQFLYRYLFVVSEQLQHMLLASKSRLGDRSSRRTRMALAAGTLGVLFAHSWERAEGIYRAMLARGFQGTFPVSRVQRFSSIDFAFLTLTFAAIATISFGL